MANSVEDSLPESYVFRHFMQAVRSNVADQRRSEGNITALEVFKEVEDRREAGTSSAQTDVERDQSRGHSQRLTDPGAVRNDTEGCTTPSECVASQLLVVKEPASFASLADLMPPTAGAVHQASTMSKDALSKLLFQSYCQGLQSAGQPPGAEVDIVALLAKEEALDREDNFVLVEMMTCWYKTGLSMAKGSLNYQ